MRKKGKKEGSCIGTMLGKMGLVGKKKRQGRDLFEGGSVTNLAEECRLEKKKSR